MNAIIFTAILLACGWAPAQNPSNVLIRYSARCNCNGGDQDCYGLMDMNGKKVTKAIYAQIDFDTVEAGKACVVTCSGKFMAVDRNGRESFEYFPYDNGPDGFSGGLARYVEEGKIGFVDTLLRKVIKAKYDFATPFNYGLSAFCTGCKKTPVYPIDAGTGKEIIGKDPEHFRYSGGRWGFINAKGEVVVDAVLDDVLDFDSVKVVVEKNKARKTLDFPAIMKSKKKAAR